MRSAILFAQLILTAAAVSAAAVPATPLMLDPKWMQGWSYNELGYDLSVNGSRVDPAVKAKVTWKTTCLARYPIASAYFTKEESQVGVANVACVVARTDGSVGPDYTFEVASNLDWAPLLTNVVAARPDDHIYSYKNGNYGRDGAERSWTEACKDVKGTSSFDATDEMTTRQQAIVFCNGTTTDLTSELVGDLDWSRVTVSQ